MLALCRCGIQTVASLALAVCNVGRASRGGCLCPRRLARHTLCISAAVFVLADSTDRAGSFRITRAAVKTSTIASEARTTRSRGLRSFGAGIGKRRAFDAIAEFRLIVQKQLNIKTLENGIESDNLKNRKRKGKKMKKNENNK